MNMCSVDTSHHISLQAEPSMSGAETPGSVCSFVHPQGPFTRVTVGVNGRSALMRSKPPSHGPAGPAVVGGLLSPALTRDSVKSTLPLCWSCSLLTTRSPPLLMKGWWIENMTDIQHWGLLDTQPVLPPCTLCSGPECCKVSCLIVKRFKPQFELVWLCLETERPAPGKRMFYVVTVCVCVCFHSESLLCNMTHEHDDSEGVIWRLWEVRVPGGRTGFTAAEGLMLLCREPQHVLTPAQVHCGSSSLSRLEHRLYSAIFGHTYLYPSLL